MAAKIIWIRQLLDDFDIPLSASSTIFCDNIWAIALAHNPILHARTKHIDIDCHFIRDCIQKQQISLHHISTKFQLVDLLTKILPTHWFQVLSNKLMQSKIPSL